MKSVMKHDFSKVPSVNIPRSTFNRTHGYKSTFNSGYLVPFYVDEALPGDTFSCQTTMFTRLTTPIVPVMDNVFLETFYFAVPIRLVWDNFNRFNGEIIDPNDPNEQTDFLIPQLQSGQNGFDVGSLSDYFGLPINVPNLSVSSLWHRAYNLIYNEWFRDQNLCSPARVNRADGGDVAADFPLRRRGKRHDYFTSALPWAQKGDSVGINLGGMIPVVGTTQQLQFQDVTNNDMYPLNANNDYSKFGHTLSPVGIKSVNLPRNPNNSRVFADLSETTGITINALREAFQIQKMLEKDARGGTRYTEIIRSHFGVISPDSRLQRPEYLGGSTDRIHFTPVQQTAPTNEVTPQGNLAAFATASAVGKGFTKSFTEHCVIIGILNVRADLTYQDGIPRMFSRQTRYDFYWPSLAHLGEQEIKNKEIYAQGLPVDDEVFGYQERWAEYRYYPSKITGLMRSKAPLSMDIWHLSQRFNSLPQLTSEFIEEKPPIARVLAVQNQPEFLLDCYIQLRCTRPMPVYSVPGLIDHF